MQVESGHDSRGWSCLNGVNLGKFWQERRGASRPVRARQDRIGMVRPGKSGQDSFGFLKIERKRDDRRKQITIY